MTTTTLPTTRWTAGPAEVQRCTEAVLMQFGIFGRRPRTGLGVLEALQNAGWRYRAVGTDLEPFRGTIRRFCQLHPTGTYYVATSGHAMALVDGVLVDTAERGPDGRRVIGAFHVYRRVAA